MILIHMYAKIEVFLTGLHNYMEMVETLLDFQRANHDGIWKLHVDSLAKMLPWLTIYDHTNYSRLGPVYLTEMKLLATNVPEVCCKA